MSTSPLAYSVPPAGPDREAFIADLAVRVDTLEREVRELKKTDVGHDKKIEALEQGLRELRDGLIALRAAGEQQVELVGSVMASLAELERETHKQFRDQNVELAEQTKTLDVQTELLKAAKREQGEFLESVKTEMLNALTSRLPPKWAIATGAFLGALIVGAAVALFQNWGAIRPNAHTPTEQKGTP